MSRLFLLGVQEAVVVDTAAGFMFMVDNVINNGWEEHDPVYATNVFAFADGDRCRRRFASADSDEKNRGKMTIWELML